MILTINKNKNWDAQKKRSSRKVRGGRESMVGKICERWVLRKEVTDGESGELTEWEDVVGAWKGKSHTEGVEWGWRTELQSWFQRHGEACLYVCVLVDAQNAKLQVVSVAAAAAGAASVVAHSADADIAHSAVHCGGK